MNQGEKERVRGGGEEEKEHKRITEDQKKKHKKSHYNRLLNFILSSLVNNERK
jgi:hypothetical protein